MSAECRVQAQSSTASIVFRLGSDINDIKSTREVEFTAGGDKLKRVTKIKYLGRMVSDDGYGTPAIEANVKKARMKWAMFKKRLTRENAFRWVMRHFYKAIAQSIIL